MADQEILRSIGRSLERLNERMDRGDRLYEENRTFMRELLLRHEKVTGGMLARLQEGTREIVEHRREFAEYRREFAEARREFQLEAEAGREAFFSILDQLRRLNGGAAGA